MTWHWISIVENSRPEQLYGCCVVEGDDAAEAIERAQELEILPDDCDLLGAEIPVGYEPDPQYRDRLLRTDEAHKVGREIDRPVLN